MSFKLHPALLGLVLLLTACRARPLADEPSMPANPTGPMPPNTILLSVVMQQLSARPGFTEAFLKEVQGAGGKKGAALLTPSLIHHLRDQILGQNWQGLDRFPGWTMNEINPTVRVVGHEAGKDAAVGKSATAGGAPNKKPEPGPAAPQADTFLDLGDFADASVTSVDFDKPARGRGFVTREYVSRLGDGVTRGDGPQPRSRRAPQRQRSPRRRFQPPCASMPTPASHPASHPASLPAVQPRPSPSPPCSKARAPSPLKLCFDRPSSPAATPSPSPIPATSPTSATCTSRLLASRIRTS